MDESYKLWKPKEGLNTLVSQVALLQIDRIIQQAREMREGGHSEKDVLEFVNRHRDLDQISKSNIYQLSLGINPKDNIALEDVLEVTQRLTSAIEGWIREDPRQWIWFHERWARRPDGSPRLWEQ